MKVNPMTSLPEVLTKIEQLAITGSPLDPKTAEDITALLKNLHKAENLLVQETGKDYSDLLVTNSDEKVEFPTDVKTFSEISALARMYAPNAKVSLGYAEDWKITIQTGYQQNTTVAPEWAGTPAEEAFHNHDALQNYAEHSSFLHEPLDIIAMRYNLQTDYNRFLARYVSQRLEESGLRSEEELFQDRLPSQAELTMFDEIMNEATVAAHEKFAEREQLINDLIDE